jgi:alpha-galactosidase
MDGRLVRTRIDAKEAFFSFVYDGERFSSLAGWKPWEARKAGTAETGVRTISATAPDGLLVVEIEVTEFAGTPVIEWLMRFRNSGRKDTAILEDVAPLDLAFAHAGPDNPSLLHSFGCCDTGTGGVGFGTGIGNYLVSNDPLQNGTSLRLSNPSGGKTLFSVPFFNLVEKQGGVIGALGWPGRYLVEVSRHRDAEIRVRAGMERTRVSLHPGEAIRTPLVLLLPWEGDPVDAHNMLRRHVLRHHAPHYDGQPVVLPLSHAGWGGMKTKTALDLVERTARDAIGYENFWMDAGWYGADREVDEFQVFNEEDWFLHAGNWRVNRVAHPDGLKPISEAAHAKGMKYLLWFEPERAVVGTPLTIEHPEWFIGEAATEFMGHSDRPYVRYRLFNFGDPQARKWMTDWMSRQIAELGIDVYRQDCNFALADFWQAADTAKRQGMAEIRYVEGLLEFWDELRRRHPKLILDITQRADLETISRGVDLTRSDYPIAPESDPIGNQAATMGLASWRDVFLPVHRLRDPGSARRLRYERLPLRLGPPHGGAVQARQALLLWRLLPADRLHAGPHAVGRLPDAPPRPAGGHGAHAAAPGEPVLRGARAAPGPGPAGNV